MTTIDSALSLIRDRAPWLRDAVDACSYAVTDNPYTRVTASGRVELSRSCGRSTPVAAEHIAAGVMCVLRQYPERLMDGYPPEAANAAASAVSLGTAAEVGVGGYVLFESPRVMGQRVFAADASAEALAEGLVIDLLRTNRRPPEAPIRLACDPDTGGGTFDVADEAGRLTPEHVAALRQSVACALVDGDVAEDAVETRAWAARASGRRSPADELRRHLTAAIDLSGRGSRSTWARTPLFVDESDDPDLLHPGKARPVSSVGVVVDVSGSMGDEQIGRAVSIVADVAATRGVDARYVCVSDRVVGPVRPVGGEVVIDRDKGRTDMRVGVSWLVESGHRCGMIITDGKTPWPDTPIAGVELVACLVGRGVVDDVPSWIRTVRL